MWLNAALDITQAIQIILSQNETKRVTVRAQFGGGRGGGTCPPLFQPGGTYNILSPTHFADGALLFHSSNYKLNQQPDFLFFIFWGGCN